MYKRYIRNKLGQFSLKKKVNFLWKRCLHCGIKIKVNPSKLKIHKGLFCSKRCFQKSRHIFVKRKCNYCNKIFFVEPSIPKQGRGKYCSKQCYNKTMEHRIIKECKNCSKKFWVWPSCLKNKKNLGIFCSKKCYGIYNRRENHYNWKGGVSYGDYPLGWNKIFKEQIRARDQYQCQLCGVFEIDCIKKLHVHHIDYDKKNLDKGMLISLCNTCHMKTNFNREYWQDLFTKGEKNGKYFNNWWIRDY